MPPEGRAQPERCFVVAPTEKRANTVGQQNKGTRAQARLRYCMHNAGLVLEKKTCQMISHRSNCARKDQVSSNIDIIDVV